MLVIPWDLFMNLIMMQHTLIPMKYWILHGSSMIYSIILLKKTVFPIISNTYITSYIYIYIHYIESILNLTWHRFSWWKTSINPWFLAPSPIAIFRGHPCYPGMAPQCSLRGRMGIRGPRRSGDRGGLGPALGGASRDLWDIYRISIGWEIGWDIYRIDLDIPAIWMGYL